MPISVDQYENLAGQVLSIYEEAERTMVSRMTKRLDRCITKPGWTEKKYAEMYAMRNELTAVNERMIYDRKSITDDVVKTAYLKAQDAFVNEAKTYAELMHVDHLSPNVTKVINILTDLNNTMDVADRNILRRANDAYSNIVGRASAMMATGTITTRQAVQMELNQFANQGIGSFVDKAGRVWDMATYAEMATITAIERATIAGYTDSMQEYGYDLAMISNHFGACPICEAWEGMIISVTGKTPGYMSLSDAEGAGVFHPRCLHFLSTYYDGISPKGRTHPRPVVAPNIGYSARSKQRYFERQERMWKRRMTAALSPEEERRAYAHVREYQDRIRELLGEYNAEQPEEVDHLFRKWYREGGRVTLSPEAKNLKPYKIPTGWQSKPVDMVKLNAQSTPNPPLTPNTPTFSTIAGAEKGEPMTFSKADTGHVNPKYYEAYSYRINCQTCVPVFEMRIRGYDVEALPNDSKHPEVFELSKDYLSIWIDKSTGKAPIDIFNGVELGLSSSQYSTMYGMDKPSAAKTYKRLNDLMKVDERYQLRFVWKSGNGAHTVSISKVNVLGSERLRLYDPQSDQTIYGEKIKEYFKYFKYSIRKDGVSYYRWPEVVRIDDKEIDYDKANKIMKKVEK